MSDIYTIEIKTRYSRLHETVRVEASSIQSAFARAEEILIERGIITLD